MELVDRRSDTYPVNRDTALGSGQCLGRLVLHLAIASNHRVDTTYSLDKTLLRAGATLGLPVSMGIQLK